MLPARPDAETENKHKTPGASEKESQNDSGKNTGSTTEHAPSEPSASIESPEDASRSGYTQSSRPASQTRRYSERKKSDSADRTITDSDAKSLAKGCTSGMSFADCELLIMRAAKDKVEESELKKIAQNPEIEKMTLLIEEYLRENKTMGYGGTAINNILPQHSQFYNRDTDVPDYDFFVPGNGVDEAKQVADFFYAKGYTEVEARAGVHHGTYKVFVKFIPIADITTLPETVFDNLYKESIVVDGIHYVPPNYLRMSMYLELSRPRGDVSRWEKVLDRLNRLNKHYPINVGDIDCDAEPLQRPLDNKYLESRKHDLVKILRNTFVRQSAVFFGGFASGVYSEHMPVRVQKRLSDPQPDFNVLVENTEKCADEVVTELTKKGFRDVTSVAHEGVGEIIPKHWEICVGETDAVAVLFEPIACHSYNAVKIGPSNQIVNIATIDTMLSFYLAFMYGSPDELNERRIPCLSKFLHEVEQRNRIKDTGELKRFSTKCIGHQQSLVEMRAEKARKFSELEKDTKEWDEWFLSYQPGQQNKKQKHSHDSDDEQDSNDTDEKNNEAPTERTNPISKAIAFMRGR